MRIMHFFLLTSYFFLAAFIASAAVPLRFAADAESPRTHQTSAYRGETLDIEARLLWRGAPLAVADGAEAAMCWQTNGMGDAWWTAPASVTTGGVITATWSPSNDVGAASYRVFLRVAGTGGTSYRANMLLRLLGSPGETPNALPLPVRVLDFSKIAWTNEPWSTTSGLTTNDVRALIEADVGPTNQVVRRNAQGDIDNHNGFITTMGVNIYDVATGEFSAAGGDGDSERQYLHIKTYGDGSRGLSSGDIIVPRANGTMALTTDIPSTNLPPLSASATVGDLVDRINAVIGALHE